MKTSFQLICVGIGSLSLCVSLVRGAQQPVHERLPNFDKRQSRPAQAATATAGKAAALARMHADLPDARIDFDPISGSPKSISRLNGFLSGPGGAGVPAAALNSVPIQDPHRVTKAFIQGHPDLFSHGPEALDQAKITRDYVAPRTGLRTVTWEQQVDGIAVFQAALISHTTSKGELVSLSSQFVPEPDRAATLGTPGRAAGMAKAGLPAAQAVALAAKNVGEDSPASQMTAASSLATGPEQRQKFTGPGLKGEAESKLIWLPLNPQSLRLCWDVLLTSGQHGEMFRVLVDAENGEVQIRQALTHYLTDATYRVFTSDSPSPFSPGYATPVTNQPPLVARSLVTWPALDTNASPAGWINDGGNETLGNNVDAHTDLNDDDFPDLPRPQGSPFRVFDFAMDLTTQDPASYASASVVQLFYLCNWYHDRLYQLGFTEAAGNFQSNNFARGGLGNDAVQADALDGGGLNNANFSTPPDGSPGRMQMYIFSGPSPRRDGDLDAEIVFHEYTHGLSWRLVGGGQGLGTLQSDGMGEGWSDFYGLTLLSEPGDDVNGNYGAGAYASYRLSASFLQNYYFGIRRYPYSTDMTKNPLTFKDIDPGQADYCSSAAPFTGRTSCTSGNANEVHNSGEVWCVALWEVRANLINKHGWATGNELMLQLVTDGMKLTPPSPNFLQARDAILQAELVNTGGANRNELWAGFAKRGMGVSATSPPSSTTTGLVEAYDIPDDLLILPVLALTAGGPVGGPFSPNPGSFVLTNTGGATLNWSLVNTCAWLNVSPLSGTLAAGGPAAHVSVTVLPIANTFPLGAYTATLRFTNQTSGVGQARTFLLSAAGRSMADDFDPGIDLTQWSAFGGTIGSTVLANSYGGFVSAPNSLWFGDAGTRSATTVAIDTSGGGTIGFSIRLADGGSWPWEQADALPDEGVVLESSTNGGVTWNLLGSYDTQAFYTWTTVTSAIPVVARSVATQFRWRQKSHSGSDFDHWALDNVSIDAQPAVFLTLAIPATATEGSAALSGSVTATPAPTNNLTVTLNSSDTTEVTVPASVTILAGQTNAAFSVTILDDLELDGPQNATITASAPNYTGGNANIEVLDNETATLSLLLPASVVEGSGAQPATLKVSTAPSADIAVSLTSSDTSEIQVPFQVTIPAGQTSVVFFIIAVNDTQIDGPQTATITAHVPNWTDGAGIITVLDNDPLTLTVTLPASAYESAGLLANAGSVCLSGSLPTNLTVTLVSSDETEMQVQASVIIPAGQICVSFNLVMADDLVVDGVQIVTLTAATPGFTNGVASMSVLDNESPPMPFNPSPTHLATNVAQTADLAWQSGALPGQTVTNDVYFGTNPTPGPAELQGTTTGTAWTLPTLAPQTTYYWQVVARRVGSTPSPVWQFTTRGVHHFDWSVIPSPQLAGTPFAATITARDEFNAVVSNFTGTVGIRGSSDSPSGVGQLIHFDDLLSDSVPVPPGYAGLDWNNIFYLNGPAYAISGYTTGSISKPNVAFNAGGNAASVGSSTGQISFVSAYLTAAWNDNLEFRAMGYAGATLVYSNQYTLSAIAPMLINFNYLGVTRVDFTSFGGTPHPGYGGSGTHFAMDNIMVGGGAATAIAIAPTNSGAFANGAWSGNITVLEPGTNVSLTASDASSHSGTSTNFNVLLANDVSVAIVDQPDPVALGSPLTNTITVANSGPAPATGITVTNFLPASVAFVSAIASQGSCALVGNRVECALGTLAGGTSATVKVVTIAFTTGQFTNVAAVGRSGADPFLGNNVAQSVTAVSVPALAMADASAVEGQSGSTGLVFKVSLVPASTLTVNVAFTTVNGTATAGSDYLATNGVLQFLPGETNHTITVAVLGDTSGEPDETFSVVLSNPTNAVISRATGIGSIYNDDAPPFIYLRSTVGSPWGTTVNESAMSRAFGTNNWQDWRYETVNPAALFSPAIAFIFMEGGDNNALEMQSFLTANLTAMQNWVAAGGRLFLNAAPNEGTGMPFGFGVTLVYPDMTSIGTAAAPFHPVFLGPFSPVGVSWNGSSFGHATISGTNLTVLITNTANGRAVLAERAFGGGLVLFGGMTTPNFHTPLAEAANLRANILVYTAAFSPCSNCPPTVTQHPANQTVVTGGTATFGAVVAGTSPLAYQWWSSCGPLTGATNLVLTLPGVTTNQSGCTYWLTVTNTYGAVTSSVAALTVLASPPDYFTELFDGITSTNDLAYRTFTFTPNGSAAFYSSCQEGAAGFPTDPTGGVNLALGAHTYLQLTLSSNISIYGRNTNIVFLASEGHVTLGSGDSSGSATFANHFALPRVSASFAHIHPTENGGTVNMSQLSNRVAFTFNKVVDYNYSRTNSFQIELFFDGRIRLTFLQMDTPVGLIGLSAGLGVPAFFTPSDLSTYGSCGPQPPVIWQQPVNQTVVAGGTANFCATALGSSPLAYQWWSSCGALPNATNPCLNQPGVTTNQSGCTYWVTITNAYGAVTSSVVTLTVLAGPPDYFTELFDGVTRSNDLAFRTLTFTPNGSAAFYSACQQTAATFPTDPTGGTNLFLGSHTYMMLPLANNISIYGRATNVVFLASEGHVTLGSGDSTGSATFANHFALPRVSASFAHIHPTENGGTVIMSQLSNRVAFTFSKVVDYNYSRTNSFQIELFFDGRIRLTFLQMDTPVGLIGLSAGLGVPAFFTPSDLSTYGSCGPQPPVIWQQPVSQTVVAGGAANFCAAALGSSPLAYQWWSSCGALPNATNPCLNQPGVTTNQSGCTYWVTITNAYGAVTSSVVTLTVLPSPPDYFTELFDGVTRSNDLAFRTLTFTPNGSAAFYSACQQTAATFPTDPTGGVNLALGAHTYLQLTLSSNISIYGRNTNIVFLASEGHVTLGSGDSSGSATFANHFALPRVSASFAHIHPTENGGTVIMSQLSNRVAFTFNKVVDYNYSRTNSFQIELFYDGRIRLTFLQMDTPVGLIGLSAGLGVPALFTPSDLSTYGVCTQAPVITQQPVSQSVRVGSNALFTVAASGTAPLRFSWRRNGVPIAVATNSSYLAAGVQLSNSGSLFTCLVSNNYGSVTSAAAVLTVTNAPRPVVQIGHSGSLLLFHWPLEQPGYELETSPSLWPAAWSPVPNQPIPIGGEYVVPVAITGTNGFYRLRLVSP